MTETTTDGVEQIGECIEAVEQEIEDFHEADAEENLTYSKGKLQGLEIARSEVIHSSNETKGDGIEHRFEVGEELEKVDSSFWKITNRIVDVDTRETLYRLRESDVGPSNYTEMLSESQIERSFHTDTDESGGDDQ